MSANQNQTASKHRRKVAIEYGPRAPRHLSDEAREWWRLVVSEWPDIAEHQLKLLQAACEAWDRMQEARRALGEHGLTFETKNGPKLRPEAQVENVSAIRFARLVRELNLDIDPPAEAVRPPRIAGRY